MSKVLKIDKNVHEGVRGFLRFLLEKEKVKAILCLTGNSDEGGISYSLISDPELIKDTEPFFPVMPSNAANVLSQLTLTGPLPEKIAAVIRPCELRGFIELVKRSQGSTENILFISYTCGGVFPVEEMVDGKINDKINKYWKSIEKNEINDDIRDTCKACEEFIPDNADITVFLAGNSEINSKCLLFLNNEKALEFAKESEGEITDIELNTGKLNEIKKNRTDGKIKLYDEYTIENLGLKGLIDIFGRCIGCHACGNACPACFCSLCYFDSIESELKPSDCEFELNKKGAMRQPPNTINYHLGRMVHTSISCVGCGSCSDVCPVDIPVSTIFKRVGESVQESYNYKPGKDLEEELPLSTFNVKEFSDIET